MINTNLGGFFYNIWNWKPNGFYLLQSKAINRWINNISYQIDMCFVVIIKRWQNFFEIRQDFIVSCHVSRQNGSNHSFSYLFKIFAAEWFENIAIIILQNSKSNAAMVIFKWRYIVIADGQFCFGVNLVDVVVAGMIQVVANTRSEKYKHFQIADFWRKIHTPRNCV